MKRLLLVFAIAGLAVASAKSYSLSLFQPATVGGTELQPGSYKVEVLDQKAVIQGGKVRSEAPVKVENGTVKYAATTVRFGKDGDKLRIEEIRLGGTNTRLLFNQ